MSDDNQTATLTNREWIVLRYLNPLMEANVRMIGEHVLLMHGLRGGSNLSAIGAAICGQLRKKGLVYYLPNLNAWRLTRSGRALLS